MPIELPGIFWARQRLPRPDLQISQLLQGSTAGTMTSLPTRQRVVAGDDHAGYLVAERERRLLDGRHAHVEVGQVGVADAAAADLDERLAGAERGQRDLRAHELARLGHLPGVDGLRDH
jgi:hypothetical protein